MWYALAGLWCLSVALCLLLWQEQRTVEHLQMVNGMMIEDAAKPISHWPHDVGVMTVTPLHGGNVIVTVEGRYPHLFMDVCGSELF